jgi:putative aldouronate transport system substrate-binding protein
MRLIEFCSSPSGTLQISAGEEGVVWDKGPDHFPVFKPEYKELRQKDWNTYCIKTGAFFYFAFQDQYWCNVPNGPMSEQDKIYDSLYRKHVKIDNFLGRMDPTGDTPEGQILAKLRELSNLYYTKMILAKNEAEVVQAYNEFLKKADELGLSKVEDAWTAKYYQFK